MHSVSDILARLIREILNKQPEILSSNQAAAVAEPVYEDRASLNKIFSEVSKQLTYKGKICRDTLSDEVYKEIWVSA